MKHDSNVTSPLGHLIDGKRVDGGERVQPVFDPATGASTKRVRMADRPSVEAAIAAAQAAYPAWRNTPPLKRARVMSRFKTLLEEHANELCALITAEHGKVFADAMGELQRGIENVEYASYAPELLKGEHSKNVGPAIDSWSEFQALGVVAGITPFNFPIMVPLWMWPMAVACGNTFVLKPSERTPSSTLRMAELALEAGLPPGVLNVVNGDKEAVDTILTDSRVKAVSFVGSTPIAESIYTTGCAHGKRVQALGGAKNFAIVMPDADIGNAVNALMGAAYGSCGERCMAIPLVVAIGDDTAEQVVDGLKAEIAKMKVGPGTGEQVDMGPLVTRQHFEKVTGFVEAGIAAGAPHVVDGRGVKVDGHEGGYYLGPCLFDHVKPGMPIYQHEIFGPVLGVVRGASLAEAMARVDAHEDGNGTCLFTRDGEAAHKHFVRMAYRRTHEAGRSMILTAGPSISAREAVYAHDAAAHGWNRNWSKYLTSFEAAFADYVGVKHAIATSSCTGALQISLMALGIGAGDEVIVPDLTWVATANAVRYVGATPVFADIELDSWNLDARSLDALITPQTKAVIAVHMYGHPARMDAILEVAGRHGLKVIEDAAPAIGAEWRGRRCGSFGDFAAFSFQGAKLLVTGEGGMLATDDDALYEKALKIWDQGRNPSRTFWIDGDGVKFKMSNVQAAVGLGQLERADELIEMKRRIFDWYDEGLAGAPGIALNREIPDARSIYWMTSLRLDESAPIGRDDLMKALKARNVDTRPVFPAISRYPIWSRRQPPQPTASRVGQQAMNLPSGVCLSKDDVFYVCRQVRDLLGA